MKKKVIIGLTILMALVLMAPAAFAKSFTIGVIIPYEIGWFTAFHQGFEKVANAQGAKIVWAYHNYKAVYAALNRISKRAGIRHIGWHVLRHTFASQLAGAGVPIIAVKDLLGHSDINMTMRYSHMSPSVLRSAVAVLGQPGRGYWQPYGNPLSTGPLQPSQTLLRQPQV